MSINKGMFSSATDQWETPQDLYDFLDAMFEFNLDPCALPMNAKCDRFFTPKQDGLKQPWEGRVFMNPPYGKEIKRWVQKAYNEAQKD
ncbi:MAG TPA: DNA N-6-adenine-methyltransferase, partial [Negativicutes bacterium]|nr:DNA N-6-adenine-methyltransferase [Negativicutes bacterium]